jgi:hypothetical protein
VTFKVFPAAASTITLKLPCKDVTAASRILVEAASARWETQALDILPGGFDVGVRLAGPALALEEIARDILARWPGETLTATDSLEIWSDLREFRWAYPNGPLLKVVLTPSQLPALHQSLQSVEGIRIHVSGGGNQAFVSFAAPDQAAVLSESLRSLSLSGVAMRGEVPLWCGAVRRPKIAEAIKQALDPEGRFPGLDE